MEMQDKTFDVFIESITKLLAEMSMKQKDEWILTRARLLSEYEQQDFIMSLTGEKKITYMPTETEIAEFCEEVSNGEIYVEYETHYYEFNSEGRYVDDWEVYYHDPLGAFSFLDRVFSGCHDLMRLGEYELAGSILNSVCRLEFRVEEAAESEDSPDGSRFSIENAVEESLLTTDMRTIAYDWIESLLMSEKKKEELEFAERLLEILYLPLCKELQLSDFAGMLSKILLDLIEKILEEEVEEINAALEILSDERAGWREKYELEKKKSRNRHLFLDLQKRCRNQEYNVVKTQKVSVLEATWKQIKELLQTLSYMRYIDDQLEISEVWKICEALIKRDKLAEEDWELRKSILADMISHEYYDQYGCYDPIMDLSKKLYTTEEEILAFADMLNEHSYYAREAADLYREHGKIEKYVRYLETHLGKTSKEYLELIECYCNDGLVDKARQVAWDGLQKCKDDLTELFVFLLLEAKKRGDDEEYKWLYASAKRRQKANIVRINEKIF